MNHTFRTFPAFANKENHLIFQGGETSAGENGQVESQEEKAERAKQAEKGDEHAQEKREDRVNAIQKFLSKGELPADPKTQMEFAKKGGAAALLGIPSGLDPEVRQEAIRNAEPQVLLAFALAGRVPKDPEVLNAFAIQNPKEAEQWAQALNMKIDPAYLLT